MLPGQWFQLAKEFIFTEVAAIEVIGRVAFILQFVRLEGEYLSTHLASNGDGSFCLFRGISRRRGDGADGSLTQDIVRDFEK